METLKDALVLDDCSLISFMNFHAVDFCRVDILFITLTNEMHIVTNIFSTCTSFICVHYSNDDATVSIIKSLSSDRYIFTVWNIVHK